MQHAYEEVFDNSIILLPSAPRAVVDGTPSTLIDLSKDNTQQLSFAQGQYNSNAAPLRPYDVEPEPGFRLSVAHNRAAIMRIEKFVIGTENMIIGGTLSARR